MSVMRAQIVLAGIAITGAFVASMINVTRHCGLATLTALLIGWAAIGVHAGWQIHRARQAFDTGLGKLRVELEVLRAMQEETER